MPVSLDPDGQNSGAHCLGWLRRVDLLSGLGAWCRGLGAHV